MFKWLTLGIVIFIIACGIIFIVLDILDIAEDFKLNWSMKVLNTIFIVAIAVSVAFIASRNFTSTGVSQILLLGSAALAFGVGNMLYVWLIDTDLGVRITINESSALIASLVHLFGTGTAILKQRISISEFRRKSRIIIYYFGIFGCIAVIYLLAIRGVIPSFSKPILSGMMNISLQDIVQWVTTILLCASAFISLVVYYKSSEDFYYWYSMGLMLLTFGVFFISLGTVENRIAWLGRFAQYISGIYFLVSVIRSKVISHADFRQPVTTFRNSDSSD